MTLEQVLQIYGLTSVEEIRRIEMVTYEKPNGQEFPVLDVIVDDTI